MQEMSEPLLKEESRAKTKDASIAGYRYFQDGFFNTRYPKGFNTLTGLPDGPAPQPVFKPRTMLSFKKINHQFFAEIE